MLFGWEFKRGNILVFNQTVLLKFANAQVRRGRSLNRAEHAVIAELERVELIYSFSATD